MKALAWLTWLILCLLPSRLGMLFMDLILPDWVEAAREAMRRKQA